MGWEKVVIQISDSQTDCQGSFQFRLSGGKKSQESHLGMVQRGPVLGDRMCRAVFPLNIFSLAFKVEEKSCCIFFSIEHYRMAIVTL